MSTKRIIIAEDDVFLRKMYDINLRREGWELILAENGQQAIDEIDKSVPDILLLDLLMPDVDGFEVLKHCKAKKYTFPIVVLSNLSQEVDMQKCRELGAKDFYVKSGTDLSALADKVEGFIQ